MNPKNSPKVTLEHKHRMLNRWNHWINFPLLMIMVISGLAIYWASPAYFLPGPWLALLGLDHRLGEALSWHFAFAILFTLNGFVYVAYLLITGGWRHLTPNRASWREALLVILHDLNLNKNNLPRTHKYNAAQRFAYSGVILLGGAVVLTGLAIYKPVQLSALVQALGGYQAARYEHFLITLAFVGFFAIHLAQVARAGWNNFRAMVTGLEISTAPPTAPKGAVQTSAAPTSEMDAHAFKALNRRRFVTWIACGVGGLLGVGMVAGSERERGLPWPLRWALRTNESFWQWLSRGGARAPDPGHEPSRPQRINGDIGMEDEIQIASWRLHIRATNLPEPLALSLDDIKGLPRVSETFEFKCIEGWSQIVSASGCRFSEFIKAYGITSHAFAGLSSVNGEYFVSMEAKSLMHPQTLLCYEMNGAPLTIENGYPLRLITPVKYGVKNIKQLGQIAFLDTRPPDYWAERGYGDSLGH